MVDSPGFVNADRGENIILPPLSPIPEPGAAQASLPTSPPLLEKASPRGGRGRSPAGRDASTQSSEVVAVAPSSCRMRLRAKSAAPVSYNIGSPTVAGGARHSPY